MAIAARSTSTSPRSDRAVGAAAPSHACRARVVVIAELRGLGGLVLEQALLDGEAEPLPSLIGWSNRLAMELQVEGLGEPGTYRDLMQGIVEVNRRAEENPKPTIAVSTTLSDPAAA